MFKKVIRTSLLLPVLLMTSSSFTMHREISPEERQEIAARHAEDRQYIEELIKQRDALREEIKRLKKQKER